MEFTDSFNVWINKNELKDFESFLFKLELTDPQKITVRFVDEPSTVWQEYTTKLVNTGKKIFFAF